MYASGNKSMLQTSGNRDISSVSQMPVSLQYSDTLPRGFATNYKVWRVNPQTSYSVYNTTDIVRFLFETADYIDPYNSYLEVEVEFDPLDYVQTLHGETVVGTPPIFMLDGPATSLIDSLILYSNAREVERVQLYDHIGYLLYDLQIPIKNRITKPHEGNAFYRHMTNDNGIWHQQNNGGTINNWCVNRNSTTTIASNNMPQVFMNPGPYVLQTANDRFAARRLHEHYYIPGNKLKSVVGFQECEVASNISDNFTANQYIPFGPGVMGSGAFNLNSHFSLQRKLRYLERAPADSFVIWDIAPEVREQSKGAFTHEYALFDGSGGIQASFQVVSGTYASGRESFQGANTSALFGQQTSSGITSLSYADQRKWFTQYSVTDKDVTYLNDSPDTARDTGYYRPYSAGSSYNFSSYFAPHVLRYTVYNGVFISPSLITTTKQLRHGYQTSTWDNNASHLRYYETRKTFMVPILSGCLGTLIPNDQWKLIPGMGCGQLLFEWRFNPNAFFASGPNFHSFDVYNNYARKGQFSPTRDQYSIKYRFTKLEMVFELWNFGVQVDQVLRNQFQNGIFLTSRMYTQGPTYAVQSSSQAMNSWQINNGIPSLRNIWFYFISTEYQTYNWCRKHFRLSRNITSIQLKMGQNYIPQQGPIRGHSGMLFKNNLNIYDYTPYWTELQRVRGNIFSLGKYPNDDTCDPLITPEQFVIDQRPYDPSALVDIYDGQALFHETRCRGQALYCVTLMNDPFDDSVLTGIDTTQFRPFELRIETANDITLTPTNSTMYILLEHDFLVKFTIDGIQTAGQG